MSFSNPNKLHPRRINHDMIISSTKLTRSSTESDEAYFERVTHLHLQNKRIRVIENLQQCKNLKVLYMYDNHIERIENLEFAIELQYLQLQNNAIKEFADLEMSHLTKLYICDNEISFVAGLEKCNKLEELHIANQRIPRFSSLTFDPNSLKAICKTLSVLEISGNNISLLSQFFILRNLRKFFCANNAVVDLAEIEGMVGLSNLCEADFSGNPCCKVPKYRDYAIAASSDSLRLLDNIPLLQHHQVAIRGLMEHRRKLGNRMNASNTYQEETRMSPEGVFAELESRMENEEERFDDLDNQENQNVANEIVS